MLAQPPGEQFEKGDGGPFPLEATSGVSGSRCSAWRCIHICCTEPGKVRLQSGARMEPRPGAPEHEERMNSTSVSAGPQT